MWSAAAERSGDAALARLPRHATSLPRVLRSQSGVAARPTRSALKIAHEYAWLAGWSFAIVNQSVAVICRSWHPRPTASPIVDGGKAKQRPRYSEKRIFAGNRQTRNWFCLQRHHLGCAFSAKTPRGPRTGGVASLCPRLLWFRPSVWSSNAGSDCLRRIFVGNVEALPSTLYADIQG